MARRPSVSIVGCGRTGGAIGLALQKKGYRIGAVWSHSRAGRQRATALLEAPVLTDPGDVVHASDVSIVAVPDDAIADMAPVLAGGVDAAQRVAHTSGAVPVDALGPIRDAGGRIASLHPLQTLPDPERGAKALRGAPVAVTCDEDDRTVLHRLVSGWGGVPFPLADDAKILYHAAAVFASNYVAASLRTAVELLERAGVTNAQALHAPLARTTVENVAAMGADAITGPVARGDVGAIRRHVDALKDLGADGEPVLDAYRALAVLAARTAGRDPSTIEEALG